MSTWRPDADALRHDMQPTTLQQPLVTVVVPAYNYGRFIGQTLESVRAQTYAAWECVVVNDGSTDDTGEVVSHYAEADARIRYIRQDNQGLGAARNTGIRNGAGEYFLFLDADDLIETKKIARQVEFLERHPEVDILYGGMRYFDTNNPSERRYSLEEENRPWVPNISGAGREVLKILIRNNIMAVNCALLRRSVVETVGPFDGSVRGVEDWDYWIRCAAAGKRFHYADFDDSLALVRTHPTSMSKDWRMMIRSMLRMHKKLETLTADEEMLRLNRERAAEDEGLLGVEEFMYGERARAFVQFLKAAAADARARFRAKWLMCAAATPFVTRAQMRKLVSTSLSGSVAGALRRA